MRIASISIFNLKDRAISKKKTNNQQFNESTNIDLENSEKILQTIN